MADESDVEQELSNLAYAALYPSGSSLPSVVTVNGGASYNDGVVGRGWPQPKSLQALLSNNDWNVSIYSRNGVERNVTRFPREWIMSTKPVHTLTATSDGLSKVTIGGTVAVPQNVAVVTGRSFAVSYAVQASDTLATIATGVAALLAAKYPGTTSVGPVVMIVGNPLPLVARVGGQGIVAKEIARVDKSFQVSIWSSMPSIRDAVAKVLMPALILPTWIPMADGSQAFCRYERSVQMDGAQVEGLYRRDLFFWIEYPTAIFMPATEIVVVQDNVTGDQISPPASHSVTDYS